MIKKEVLVKEISKLVELKKNLIPLLNQHVSSSLFFSGIPEAERKTMIGQLQGMVLSQTRHIETLIQLKDEVSQSGQNVY